MYSQQHNPTINTNQYPGQYPAYAQPGVNQQPYVIQITGSPGTDYSSYSGKVSVGLGIAQLVLGILCLVFGIVLAITISNEYTCVMLGVVGHGIWCGVMFIIAGCFAIAAGIHKSLCLIVASMVLSIIAAVFTIGIYTTSSLDIAITSAYYYSAKEYCNKTLIVETLLLVFAFAEMIIAIITSALGCKVCCCKNQPNNQEMTQQVVYLPQLQPQPQATPHQALQPQPPRQAMSFSNPEGDAPPQYCEKRPELKSANDKQQLL